MRGDPSSFEWWARIIIPSLSALASLGVLVFSVRTANRARTEAERSEKARVEEKANQVEDARRRRFTTRLSEILDGIPELLDKLQRERSHLQETGSRNERVTTYALIVRVIAAMLEADKDESNMLQHFRALLIASENHQDPWVQSVAITVGADLLVAWVQEPTEGRGALVKAMASAAAAKTTEELRRIRRTYVPGTSIVRDKEGPRREQS